MRSRLTLGIIPLATLASAAVVAAASGGGTSVAPAHGTFHLRLVGQPGITKCPGPGGASLLTAHFAGTITSPTAFANGKLSLSVREVASATDDAVVHATGKLTNPATGIRKATVRLRGVDHGNDLDGLLVLRGRHKTLTANVSSRQNPDGTANGEFGAGEGSQQPANTAVIVTGSCQ